MGYQVEDDSAVVSRRYCSHEHADPALVMCLDFGRCLGGLSEVSKVSVEYKVRF